MHASQRDSCVCVCLPTSVRAREHWPRAGAGALRGRELSFALSANYSTLGGHWAPTQGDYFILLGPGPRRPGSYVVYYPTPCYVLVPALRHLLCCGARFTGPITNLRCIYITDLLLCNHSSTIPPPFTTPCISNSSAEGACARCAAPCYEGRLRAWVVRRRLDAHLPGRPGSRLHLYIRGS